MTLAEFIEASKSIKLERSWWHLFCSPAWPTWRHIKCKQITVAFCHQTRRSISIIFNMWKYSWFKAGLLEERPPEFLNPVDFCFGKRSGLGICSCCDQPEFIMCSYCEQLLGFHHFWHGPNGLGHWCVMEHVHWIELNLFICCLILFCSAKSVQKRFSAF